MKQTLLLALVIFASFTAFGQDAAKSDLYLKVVEVMKVELNYTYDPIGKKRAIPKTDTIATNDKKLIGKHSTPIDWPPLIILDGKPKNIDDLNKYKLENIESINAKNEKELNGLYGTIGKNGAIFITTIKDSKN